MSRVTVVIEGEALPTVYLEGQPVPAERVRRGRGNRWYVPKKTMEFRRRFAEAVQKAWEGIGGWPGPPWLGPVALLSIFSRQGKRGVDVDNLHKSIQDAMIGIAYMDDHQVEAIVAVKMTDTDDPGTSVKLVRLGSVKILVDEDGGEDDKDA